MNEQSFEQEQDGMKQLRRRQLTELFLLAALLIAAFVFWRPQGTNLIQVDFADTSIVITAPDSSSRSIPYQDISGVELALVQDYGTCVSGSTEDGCAYGTWSNETWGEYYLYAKTDLKNCMVITEENGTVTVVNFSSESMTSSTVTAFQELLANEQAE
jgi:hypothetical protein